MKKWLMNDQETKIVQLKYVKAVRLDINYPFVYFDIMNSSKVVFKYDTPEDAREAFIEIGQLITEEEYDGV
jgi:hypothetical protein